MLNALTMLLCLCKVFCQTGTNLKYMPKWTYRCDPSFNVRIFGRITTHTTLFKSKIQNEDDLLRLRYSNVMTMNKTSFSLKIRNT